MWQRGGGLGPHHDVPHLREAAPTKGLTHEKDVRYREKPGPGHPATECDGKRLANPCATAASALSL